MRALNRVVAELLVPSQLCLAAIVLAASESEFIEPREVRLDVERVQPTIRSQGTIKLLVQGQLNAKISSIKKDGAIVDK